MYITFANLMLYTTMLITLAVYLENRNKKHKK